MLTDFISKIIEYQQAMKTGQNAKADNAVERLLQILDQSERAVSPRLQLQVLEASFSHRRADTAIAVALKLAKTPGLDTRIVERVQKLLNEYRRKQSESRQLLAVDQIPSAMAHIRKTGWNDDLIKRIRFSIDFWQKSGQLGEDDVESLRFSLDAIAVKFGVSVAS
jgi:hypothetical protein